ncbi:hypothetical protein TNCV_4874731 [Trichonephila clavipes]|nr:hypothetical protein TNCV_4874731 [Trichonephila clavipes]
MDLVILNNGQVMKTTPELAIPFPNYHINGRTWSLDGFYVHLSSLHGGSFVALRLKLMKRRPRVRYHDH